MPSRPASTAEKLVTASRRLAREVDALSFRSPVRHVYNPLRYAREPHELYLARYAAGRKRVVFLGMNPGPWGMAQTGVPFGEVSMVRDWLGIHGAVKAPDSFHPRVVVRGFDSPRSEVSGSRLWGMLRARFGTADAMARQMFVSNYCPLLFLDGDGKNLTPDHVARADQPALFEACDRFLDVVIAALEPQWLVGVGLFAEKRLRVAIERTGAAAEVVSILHPSPANPRAQKDWAGTVTVSLERQGVWKVPG